MLAFPGEVLAQATQSATAGAVASKGASLPAAGFSLPLIILTTVAIFLITFGAVKFFGAFKKF